MSDKPWSNIDLQRAMLAVMEPVDAFHSAADIPFPKLPGIPPEDRKQLRINLSEEEGGELVKALREDDLVKIADGIADVFFVGIGTALEYGIPLEVVWTIVCYKNGLKIDPATGKVYRREDGKIMKPPGWTPPDPDIAQLLLDCGADSSIIRVDP